jgi:integrase
MSEMLLDRAGRRRSPATMPDFHAGRPPRNKGLRYPADPPRVEEIVAVMRTAGDGAHGRRLRGLIVVLWRAGLRIQEALALAEADLDYRRGALLVRRGKGGRRREVGMDTALRPLPGRTGGRRPRLPSPSLPNHRRERTAWVGRAVRRQRQALNRSPGYRDLEALAAPGAGAGVSRLSRRPSGDWLREWLYPPHPSLRHPRCGG